MDGSTKQQCARHLYRFPQSRIVGKFPNEGRNGRVPKVKCTQVCGFKKKSVLRILTKPRYGVRWIALRNNALDCIGVCGRETQ